MPQVVFQPFLIFIIIFSCLAYGNATLLPLTITETIIAIMVLWWLVDMVYKGNLSFVKTGLWKPILIFLCLVIFQLIPLPLGLIGLLSPGTATLYEKFTPVNSAARFFSLSICPDATTPELFKVLIYIGIFFLVINMLKTKRQLNFIINTIIFFGLIISLFGIIQKYAYSGKVYWFDPPNSAPTPFGPFVNRNNFAGYINMVIPLALGYSLIDMPMSKRIIYGFCAGIMSSALFLSLSRGGILVYILVSLFILICSRYKTSLKNRRKFLSAWVFTLLGLLIFLGDVRAVWQRLSGLFGKGAFTFLGHGYSWLDTLRIWQDFPLFGTGLGTFGNISSMYKSTPECTLFIYAHNDYLQLLSEVGLLGFLVLSIFFILYFKSVLKMWVERHDPYAICLSLGGIASIFAMLVYSFLDFNLHIPANALLFFIIMGLIYRLVHTRFTDAIPK